MGYFYNHLATLATGAFAAVLTFLWFVMGPMFPVLDFVFLMAVPIMWFLVVMCWLSQKSADYMHHHEHPSSEEKKNYNKPITTSGTVYTPEGTKVSSTQIQKARSELTDELNELRDTVKLKDSEIERLNQEIGNLQTLVQIESLKSELANLKMLASEEKQRRNSRKK